MEAEPTPQERTDAFFKSVLAPGPAYYFAYRVSKDGDEYWNHASFSASYKAQGFGKWLVSKGHQDLYFAIAAFKEKSPINPQTGKPAKKRSTANLSGCRVLVVDVDFKDYAGAKEAARTLGESLVKAELPAPSWMVMSGGGFHVYWVLEDALSPADHRIAGRRLQNTLKPVGLKADWACTVDTCRILRVPMTFNSKYDPPRPVELHPAFNGKVYKNEEFLGRLAEGAVVPMTKGVDAGSMAGAIRLDPGELDNSAMWEAVHQPSLFATIAEKCGVVKSSLARRGEGDGYHLWKNLLHLASFCEDGAEHVHRLSDGHEGYSEEMTESRFQESVDAQKGAVPVGPTRCESFNGPECAACPFRGDITSPIQLGRQATELLTEDGEPQQPTYADEARNMTYRLVPSRDPDNGELLGGYDREVLFDHFAIIDPSFAETADGGWEFSFDTLMPYRSTADGMEYRKHRVVFCVGDKNWRISKWPKALLRARIALQEKEEKVFAAVVNQWINHLKQRNRGEPAKLAAPYGWADGPAVVDKGYLGFSYAGETFFRRDGELQVTRAGTPDKEHLRTYNARGTLEGWQQGVNSILVDARAGMQIPLAAAFGAPLMIHAPNADAFMIALVGAQSGAGKSTALRAGATVWGDPTQQAHSLDDTVNAVRNLMSGTPDLPHFWDDIQGTKAVKEFLRFSFTIAMGRDKRRLTAEASQREAARFRTIMTAASNLSLLDHADAEDVSEGATRGRMLEFHLKKRTGADLPPYEAHLLRTNHGVAGRKYAQLLAQAPQDALLENFLRQRKLLQAQFGSDDADMPRFWLDAGAAMVLGASLAKAWKLLEFDVPKLRGAILGAMQDATVVVTANNLDAHTELLAQILQDNDGRILKCDRSCVAIAKKGRGPSRKVLNLDQLRNGLTAATAEIGIKDQKIVLSSAAFKVAGRRSQSGTTPLAMMNQLIEGFSSKVATRGYATVGKGTPFSLMQSRVLVIDLRHAPDAFSYWSSKLAPDEEDDGDRAARDANASLSDGVEGPSS